MIEDRSHRHPNQLEVDYSDLFLDDPDKWNLIAGNEMFMIRKDTINRANEQLNKKLSKEYQLSKIDYRKKVALIKDPRQRLVYDYENYPEKKDMFGLREIFAKDSRSNQLMKASHQKMKKRVEKISKVTQAEDSLTIRDADIAKFTIRSHEGSNKIKIESNKISK